MVFMLSQHNVSLLLARKNEEPYSNKGSSFCVLSTYIIFIHPYYSAVLGSLFVTESVKKLYKIVHNLNVEVFQNTGGILLIIKQKYQLNRLL